MLQVPFIRDNQKLVLEGLAKRNFVNAREIIANNKDFLTHLSMGGEGDGTKEEVLDEFFDF